MFQYKFTFCREHNMPVLKPTANDKLLYIGFHSLQQAPLLMLVMYKMYKIFTNTGTYYRLQNLVNNSLSSAVGFNPSLFCSLKMV